MILLISYSIKFLKMWNAKKNHGCINSLKCSKSYILLYIYFSNLHIFYNKFCI